MNIETVAEFYKSLSLDNLHQLNDVYHKDVQFHDPAHEIHGIENLYNYFKSLYKNVDACTFHIRSHMQKSSVGFIVWEMSLQHPRLKGGKTILVDGCTHIEFYQDKVLYHRDYFDLGEMLYENIPVLGETVRSLKNRLGK
ncbi:nuclear transport factor 2 family protein [Vibrio sp. JC009]|uniref:nuclear transport factor 2 family protein n=1 Tax=Vibrio sp. JC009 TaxID=2912314 RepID=UPI0023AF4468|nr:nuclear transport factor 2 family protein [Vibrio sp. JC009]WED22724.1 nuclear transport factor 2 family protein [Vibrio sp. JC009]